MSPSFDEIIPVAATAPTRSRPLPRQVFQRLRRIAGLMRADDATRESCWLLWRSQDGNVAATRVSRALTAGRDPGCDIVLDRSHVSRRHRVFRPREGEVELEVVGSSNGTLVNGVPVRTRTLQDGDAIELGGALMVFVR